MTKLVNQLNIKRHVTDSPKFYFEFQMYSIFPTLFHKTVNAEDHQSGYVVAGTFHLQYNEIQRRFSTALLSGFIKACLTKKSVYKIESLQMKTIIEYIKERMSEKNYYL